MTWYAHNLYLQATATALNILKNKPNLLPFLYLVPNLDELTFPISTLKHTLCPDGLIVIRPIGPTQVHSSEWYAQPVLPWESLQPATSFPVLETHVEEEFAPPVGLLQFIKELSIEVSAPVIYYSSFMWGGEIEFEAAWAFTPLQHTYISCIPPDDGPQVRVIEEQGEEVMLPGDALKKGLEHINIYLPSSFFALHTRCFPWEDYHVV
jgi:hypothetical protein